MTVVSDVALQNKRPGFGGAWYAIGAEILAPQKNARDLAGSPRWAIALMLIVVVSLLTNSINAGHVELASEIRTRVRAQNPHISEEDVEEAVSLGLKASKFSGILSAALAPLTLLATAG